MTLAWEHEVDPCWDADKQRVFGDPAGVFRSPPGDGESLEGEWWLVVGVDGRTLAFGGLDISWGGDAEILLGVDPAHHEQGIGTFVLTRLEAEAHARGVNYVYNTIGEHPGRDLVHDWLVVRGFRGAVDGDLRKRVGSPITPTRAPVPEAVAYDIDDDPGGQPPGDEVQGGYVDIDDHRF